VLKKSPTGGGQNLCHGAIIVLVYDENGASGIGGGDVSDTSPKNMNRCRRRWFRRRWCQRHRWVSSVGPNADIEDSGGNVGFLYGLVVFGALTICLASSRRSSFATAA